MNLTLGAVLGTLLVFLAGCDPDTVTSDDTRDRKIDYTSQFVEPDGEIRLSRTEVLYVPVYSNILTGEGARPIEMAATLAIRNTDLHTPIFVTRIAYYDTAVELAQTFLDGTYGLGPLASAFVVINVADKRGGFGANFIVEWGAEGSVNDPIVETVMLGSSGTQGYSFSSPARVIKSSAR